MNVEPKHIVITDEDINNFIKTYFNGQCERFKTILKNMKKQKFSSWVEIIWSASLRKFFSTKNGIELKKEKNEKDVLIFEELMIMIPLNYIYWRDAIKNEDIFPPTNQKFVPICWAHAIATGIVLAYRRIIGRNELKFKDVKNYLIEKYGTKEQCVEDILPEIMKHYGLHCDRVEENEINLCNPNGSYHFYIAVFWLTGLQWSNFLNFFSDPQNKDKIITWSILNKSDTVNYQKDAGHAVVLIDADEKSLTFLNSYGKDWGNHGTFSVSRDAIKGMNFHFFSIYWLTSDLTKSEQSCYENRRKKAVEAFYQILDYTSLLSLQKANEVINMVKGNQSNEVENDMNIILKEFCKDYWQLGEQNDYRANNLPPVITVCEFNDLYLNEQINAIDRIINITSGTKKDFYTKIKKVLNCFNNKNYITKRNGCVDFLYDKNKKLIDIEEEECEVKFSDYAIEMIYDRDFMYFGKLINIISKFEKFKFELIYPH